MNKLKEKNYKGYKNKKEAEARWTNHPWEEAERKNNQMKIKLFFLLTVIVVVLHLILV
jgi:hypothetical protein